MFAGSNATESQRATRGVLEHWAQVNSGAVDPNPEVSAKDIKAAQLKSSVGKALKFPAEILGDVYANPYPKRDRRQEARESIAAREASLLPLYTQARRPVEPPACLACGLRHVAGGVKLVAGGV